MKTTVVKFFLKNGHSIVDNEIFLKELFKDIDVKVTLNKIIISCHDYLRQQIIFGEIIDKLDTLKFKNKKFSFK